MTDVQTNGNGEPSPKEKEIAAYLADRSEQLATALGEVARLTTALKGANVALEVHAAQLTDAISRAQTAELVRDQAVARRAQLEALLTTIQAALGAFQIKHAPLVVDEETPAIGRA